MYNRVLRISLLCIVMLSLLLVIASSGIAAEKAEFVWRMQVIHGVGSSDFKQDQEALDEIYTASNGRLKIELFPNGAFANSLEAFQACGEGVFELHSSWPTYAKGVEHALLTINTGSMQMDAHDMWVWYYEAGGWDLAQKAFDKLNLKLAAIQIWGTEVLMANDPFKSLEEMKGTKMRTSDPRLLAKNSIAGVTLPLEEVFTGLATGMVDSSEFGHLAYNKNLG